MEKFSLRALAVVCFLLIGVFVAGCSNDAALPAEVPEAPTQSGVLYSAGDIVKNPASSGTSTALLITGYDSATDMYERAYIYPNSDGSWGYRIDTKTEMVRRSVIEKVYTTKVGTIEVSSVPIGTPVATVPTGAAGVTIATTVPISTTATTTTTQAPSPRIKNIEPDKGKTGTTVSITNLDGQYFQSGVNVSLRKSKESPILFTDVVVTTTLITGKVTIPSDTEIGYWDVVVKNPDGQYDTYENAFLVQQGTSSTTTTTTTTTVAANAPTVTDVDPEFSITGGYIDMHIYGTNFRSGISGKLRKEYKADIIASSCFLVDTSTHIRCFFDIPAGSQGSWILILTNTDGTSVTKSNAFTVNM